MSFWKWSKVAANNGTADSTCPFPEGMAASALNDGTRGMMAAASKYRDDIGGSLITAGSSSAYTLATYQIMVGQPPEGHQVTFTAHATNAAPCNLAIDGGTAYNVVSAGGVILPAGSIIAGNCYTAHYAAGAWVMHNIYGNPYNIPLGGLMPFIGTATPNSSFVFPYGQAISRTTYATLFALTSTTYGIGDNSTTFNIPDLRGTVPAGVDNMGGVSGGRMPGLNPGTFLGSQTQTLGMANLPASPAPVAAVTNTWQPTINAGGNNAVAVGTGATPGSVLIGSGTSVYASTSYGVIDAMPARTVSGNTANLGSGTAFNNTQPTLGLNYILRII